MTSNSREEGKGKEEKDLMIKIKMEIRK